MTAIDYIVLYDLYKLDVTTLKKLCILSVVFSSVVNARTEFIVRCV